MKPLVISNDSEALDLLERILDGEAKLPEIEFKNWPRFEMKVEGDIYKSTITPDLMKGFLELQTAINKSYALARYSASSRNLKDADREELQLVLQVKDGSSEFFAKLIEQIDKIGDAFMQMESKDKVKTILIIGLFVLGGISYNSYLDNKVQLRTLDVQAITHEADRNERLETLRMVAKQNSPESERANVVYSKAVEQYPEVKSMEGYVAQAYDKLLSGTKDADSVKIQGRKLPGAAVNEISSSKRQASIGDVVTGVYKILGVDHSVDAHYKFKLRDVLRGEEFSATLPKDGAMVTDQILDVLQDAEWNNKVVLMKVLTKNNHGKIINAQIEKVTEITDQEIYSNSSKQAKPDNTTKVAKK
ncbi:hypothetical protein [Pseudomonas fluorescens]|uniref:Uncharacterized protein n=1 Tax=Pseudomonas fluorescens TaxID=294 RepID=A0A0F4TW69_PSEFL|nr:hypothetical protein [Pseudomonas fluorescens]KJZ47622.1 hypothetical protein VC34_04460 [Pseudomonas fluorescens]